MRRHLTKWTNWPTDHWVTSMPTQLSELWRSRQGYVFYCVLYCHQVRRRRIADRVTQITTIYRPTETRITPQWHNYTLDVYRQNFAISATVDRHTYTPRNDGTSLEFFWRTWRTDSAIDTYLYSYKKIFIYQQYKKVQQSTCIALCMIYKVP